MFPNFGMFVLDQKTKTVSGFSISQTDSELAKIEQVFDLLPDTTDVYKNWRELVVRAVFELVYGKTYEAMQNQNHIFAADERRFRGFCF